MQPIDVDVNIDEALNVDIQLAAPISVPITLAPDVIISVDVDAVGPAGPNQVTNLIEPGTNVTFDGSGTLADPYVVNASGGSAGAVTSVNGQTGVVVLTAANVGAPTGSGTSTGTNTGDQDLSSYATTSALTSGLATKEPTIAAGTTSQYWRGDKSWQTLDKTAVGLANVDNTSDATKNAAAVSLTNKNLTSGTNTFPTFNQSTTGSAATLTTARTIGTLTGDVTTAGSTFNGSANNTNATVLATVNSNVGTFGSASSVNVQTVNAKGLTTAASSVAIQIAESQVTNLVTDLAGKESALTFSTGLTRSTNTITVNTSQNISTLSNLTSNGLVRTSGGTGALSIAIAGIDYQTPITLTTVGTSGASTLIGSTLNIPNYAGGGGSAGITRSISSISTNTNAGSTALVDYVYIVSAGATLTLPTAVGNTNAYEVTNSGATNITVNTTSSQTINGNLSMLISPNSSRKFYSDTANWRVF